MMRVFRVGVQAVVAAALMVSAAGLAQDAPAFDPEAVRKAQEEFNKVPNTPGDGPYPAVVEADSGLPGHVVSRPADLSPFCGGKLPVLIWGNGGCADDGTAHRLYLAEIASYGYLVVAAGHWRSGPGATDGPAPRGAPTAAGTLPPPATTAADVLAGLDWAEAENARSASKYYGRIDRSAVAVAGHSCGGLQAIELSADPRIKTVMINNSGIFNEGGGPISGMSVSKDMLANFHQPVIYLLGGPTDVAYPNGTDDFARLTRVPAVLANLPVGHGSTFSKPLGGAVAHVAVDWLEWQLKGDKTAARTFVGENCRLCAGTEWSIERKGM
jgi:dienelactone hydrolase